MSDKLNNIVFNILTVLAYFYGVALCATIVLIPVGVYSVIAAHRYSAYADMNMIDATYHKKQRTAWIIFGCVLYFPFGLIGLLGLRATNNNIDVSSVTASSQDGQSAYGQNSQPQAQPVEVEVSQPLSPEERREKIEKLNRFKQQGLITEDEYNQAVNDLK